MSSRWATGFPLGGRCGRDKCIKGCRKHFNTTRHFRAGDIKQLEHSCHPARSTMATESLLLLRPGPPGILFVLFSLPPLLTFSCLIKMPIKCTLLIATRTISGWRKNRNTRPKPANGTQVNYKLQMATTANKYHQQPQTLTASFSEKTKSATSRRWRRFVTQLSELT